MCEFIRFFSKIGNEHNKIERWYLKLQDAALQPNKDASTNISSLNRGLYWRLMLGMLPSLRPGMDVGSSWSDQLSKQNEMYQSIKGQYLPSVTAELIQDIEKDLRRLHFSNSGGSVPQDFFLVRKRYEGLFHILSVWCVINRHLSYRQGMHEICAVIMYVVELEAEAWTFYSDDENRASASETGMKLSRSFSLSRIEAYTYAIFDRIMKELGVLYDPAIESYSILHFCHRIQDDSLFDIDPDLEYHLRVNDIQAPFYGICWARLMLVREFPLSEDHLLKIWDALIACALVIPENCDRDTTTDRAKETSISSSTRLLGAHANTFQQRDDGTVSVSNSAFDAQKGSASWLLLQSSPAMSTGVRTALSGGSASSPPCSPLLSTAEAGSKSDVGSNGGPSGGTVKVRPLLLPETSCDLVPTRGLTFPYSPLLLAIEDFILALLINMRDKLLAGNMYDMLAMLMNFVYIDRDVSPLISLACLIRKKSLRFISFNPLASAPRIIVPIEEDVKKSTRVFVDLIDENALVPIIHCWEAGKPLSAEVMEQLWERLWITSSSALTPLAFSPTSPTAGSDPVGASTTKDAMSETEFRSFLISIWVAQLVYIKKRWALTAQRYKRSTWLWSAGSKQALKSMESSTKEKVHETEQKLETALMTHESVHQVFMSFDKDSPRSISREQFVAKAPALISQLLGPTPPAEDIPSPGRPIIDPAKVKARLSRVKKSAMGRIPKMFPSFSPDKKSQGTSGVPAGSQPPAPSGSNGQQNGRANALKNRHTDGHATGHANGQTSGHTNGYASEREEAAPSSSSRSCSSNGDTSAFDFLPPAMSEPGSDDEDSYTTSGTTSCHTSSGDADDRPLWPLPHPPTLITTAHTGMTGATGNGQRTDRTSASRSSGGRKPMSVFSPVRPGAALGKQTKASNQANQKKATNTMSSTSGLGRKPRDGVGLGMLARGVGNGSAASASSDASASASHVRQVDSYAMSIRPMSESENFLSDDEDFAYQDDDDDTDLAYLDDCDETASEKAPLLGSRVTPSEAKLGLRGYVSHGQQMAVKLVGRGDFNKKHKRRNKRRGGEDLEDANVGVLDPCLMLARDGNISIAYKVIILLGLFVVGTTISLLVSGRFQSLWKKIF